MQSIYLAGVVREGEILGDVDECMLTHGLQVKKTAHLKVIALFLRHLQCFYGCYLCDGWHYYMVC